MGRQFTTPLGSQANHITTATTTAVTTKRATLYRVVVNSTAAGTVTIQDKNSVVKAILKSSVAEGTYTYDMDMAGITIITGAASDLTVVYDDRS